MNAVMRAAINSALLGLSAAMPARLMAHWMWLLRSNPRAADIWGYHIRNIHYHEPLPDFRALTVEALERRRVPPSIDFRIEGQVALLRQLAAQSRRELDMIAGDRRFDFANIWFTALDACAYYGLIRHLKPRRVVEIGSGYSTRIAAMAFERNAADGRDGELVCIEPYPEARLTDSGARFKLIEKPVQDVPVAYFEELGADDILFIDSSHVATTGSDVCYEFLDVLPRLKRGVWVHVHDIFFPRDYPPEWVLRRRIAYNEQYMLEAFLSGNADFVPRLAHHWLMLDHRSEVEALCPPAALNGVALEQLGGSFWMRRER